MATFNLVYLLMTVLTGYATFLLARHVTGRAAEAWLAGLLFAWSPILVTRGEAPTSAWWRRRRWRFSFCCCCGRPSGSASGTRSRWVRPAAWAASADAYYAVYCVIIAALFMLGRALVISAPPRGPATPRGVLWTLDVLIFCVAGLMLSMMISGGWQFTILGRVASMRSLYTPMLVLTLLVAIRLAWPYRAYRLPFDGAAMMRVMRLGAAAAVAAVALLAPALHAVGVRIAEGRWDNEAIFWRSSPHGVDLAAFVLPNPNHPLAPDALRAWLTMPRPDALFRERRLAHMAGADRRTHRVAHGMAHPPLLGRPVPGLRRARAGTLHSRRSA